jgi:hypothetical protein
VTLTTWHPLSAKVGTNFAESGGRSVDIVRSRTQATESSLVTKSFSVQCPLILSPHDGTAWRNVRVAK